jgi:hypothetical protein
VSSGLFRLPEVDFSVARKQKTIASLAEELHGSYMACGVILQTTDGPAGQKKTS